MLYLVISLVREGIRVPKITMKSKETAIIMEVIEEVARELKLVEIEIISSRWLKR
jgi:hypothetical protein